MNTVESGRSDEWYTPKYVFDAMRCVFDLDVSAPVDRTHCCVPARIFITDNSLDLPWRGFVWMNAPFGNQADKFKWLNKFISHANGVALTPDRTSAPWWQHMAKSSDAVLFVAGKIKFIRPDGSIGESPAQGACLFAIGEEGKRTLMMAEFNGLGKLYL